MLRIIILLIFLAVGFRSFECASLPELPLNNGEKISSDISTSSIKETFKKFEMKILKSLMTKLFPNCNDNIDDIETLPVSMGNKTIIDFVPSAFLKEAAQRFLGNENENGDGFITTFQNSKPFDEWFNNFLTVFLTEVPHDPVDFEN